MGALPCSFASLRSAIIVIVLFILTTLAGITMPAQGQGVVDSTWTLGVILFDTNKDDTLDYNGQTVTVGGIANTGFPQVHTTRLASFIQGDTYGLPFFSKAMGDSFAVGDSLVLTGRLQKYYGQNEMYVESYEVYPEVNRSLTAQSFSEVASSPDQFVGMLVKGTAKVTHKGTINNGIYLSVSYGDSVAFEPKVFVSNFHKSFNEFNFDVLSIGDEIAVTGVLSEFEDAPTGHSYLIYLRTPDDLEYAGFPQYYIYGIAGLLLLFVIGAAIWILSLRRKMEQKTKKIKQSLEEKEILLREIHHRVKNNLSIISGLLELQKDTSTEPTTKVALQNSQARIRSMALIHDKLYQTDSLSDIELNVYLRELVEGISATLDNNHQRVALNFDLDQTEIDIDKVVPCGLLVNELVVNAYKHAFSTVEEGELTLKLKNHNHKVVLTIADNGPGLPEDFALGTGDSLGSMLIQTFANQLDADLHIDRSHEGVAFVFTFPAN
ncbi:sensor histidine kinase [Fodinibius salsisoli]|uniref:histidine kinase n=1 Tax=Fodinibius salsisoli TaxID=2820877 RepID=A0ABT3PSG2_9BACT|nr:sensor histidine kinase [Fodinibius salsisoli]MCW9708798.1 sensor histidine kinase [Fodinibius salsisoli]